MPSHLVPQNPDFLAKWVEEAQISVRRERIQINSPWQGYTPDLDPHRMPPSAASTMEGLVARPEPNGRGEVLMADAGYAAMDVANLPLVTTTGSHTNILMIAQFNRTDSSGDRIGEWNKSPLVLVGGNSGTQATAELWRLIQAGTWEKVPWATVTGVGPPASDEASSGRDDLSDWAEFPAGAPGRSAYNGNIAEPVFVWCNLADQVMIYPVDDDALTFDDGAYEPVTDQFGGDFRAKTVEHFNGRLYFGNTIENGTHHRQRIRRTALFTADPLNTTAGAGAFDIRDFSGDLLRLEKLGDVMAAYFEDGVAFIRSTDVATSPDGVQVLRERRGLLSTHSIVPVGDQEHFGIFDDGWFILDPSGRWTEVGVAEIDGVRVRKWKETFYGQLDIENRSRLYIEYDGNFIRIAFPTKVDQDAGDDVQEVWIFDPRGNRVFRDRYPVTCFGLLDQVVKDGVTWENLTGTWAEQTGSWASYGAKFGLKSLVHGTTDGYVVKHDYGIFSRFDTGDESTFNPTFSYSSAVSAIGDPTALKRALKIWMEYIQTMTDSVTFTITGDTTEGTQQGTITVSPTGGVTGDINTAFLDLNFTAVNLGFTVSGTSPILIRSFIMDVELPGVIPEWQERTA